MMPPVRVERIQQGNLVNEKHEKWRMELNFGKKKG